MGDAGNYGLMFEIDIGVVSNQFRNPRTIYRYFNNQEAVPFIHFHNFALTVSFQALMRKRLLKFLDADQVTRDKTSNLCTRLVLEG